MHIQHHTLTNCVRWSGKNQKHPIVMRHVFWCSRLQTCWVPPSQTRDERLICETSWWRRWRDPGGAGTVWSDPRRRLRTAASSSPACRRQRYPRSGTGLKVRMETRRLINWRYKRVFTGWVAGHLKFGCRFLKHVQLKDLISQSLTSKARGEAQAENSSDVSLQRTVQDAFL